MEEIKRENVVPTICCCVVDGNSCNELTSGPDEPICRECVQNEHPQREDFNPMIKTIEVIG